MVGICLPELAWRARKSLTPRPAFCLREGLRPARGRLAPRISRSQGRLARGERSAARFAAGTPARWTGGPLSWSSGAPEGVWELSRKGPSTGQRGSCPCWSSRPSSHARPAVVSALFRRLRARRGRMRDCCEKSSERRADGSPRAPPDPETDLSGASGLLSTSRPARPRAGLAIDSTEPAGLY